MISRFNLMLLVATIVIGLIAWRLLWPLTQSGLYFPVYPGINTEYTTGFAKKNFQRISPGMTTNEVVAILGAPFYKLLYAEFEAWEYAREQDRWVKFAWVAHSVMISNGIVTDVGTSVRD